MNNQRGQEEEKNIDQGEIEDSVERERIDRNRPIAKIARHVIEFDLKYLEKKVQAPNDNR